MGGGDYLSGFFPPSSSVFNPKQTIMDLLQTLLEVGMLAFLATLTLTMLD